MIHFGRKLNHLILRITVKSNPDKFWLKRALRQTILPSQLNSPFTICAPRLWLPFSTCPILKANTKKVTFWQVPKCFIGINYKITATINTLTFFLAVLIHREFEINQHLDWGISQWFCLQMLVIVLTGHSSWRTVGGWSSLSCKILATFLKILSILCLCWTFGKSKISKVLWLWRSGDVIIEGWGEYQCTYPFLGSP